MEKDTHADSSIMQNSVSSMMTSYCFFLVLFCFNLGFALLQTGNSAPALPPEGGFGSPRCLCIQVCQDFARVSHSSPKLPLYGNLSLHLTQHQQMYHRYLLTGTNPDTPVTGTHCVLNPTLPYPDAAHRCNSMIQQ